jgi:hypothetical protein
MSTLGVSDANPALKVAGRLLSHHLGCLFARQAITLEDARRDIMKKNAQYPTATF